jgi:hypothetical protein
VFPEREDPKVVRYSIRKTHGNLLEQVDKAFNKQKPLFSLAIYYPLFYYKGPDTSIDPLIRSTPETPRKHNMPEATLSEIRAQVEKHTKNTYLKQVQAPKWRRERRMELELPKLWNDYVTEHLLPRLYGFELMMAPYAIAHMKLGLKLHETG